MRKSLLFVISTFCLVLLLGSCNNSRSSRDRFVEEQLWQKDSERELPYNFIEVSGEILGSDKLFSNKSTIRGHIRSKAQYTKYSNVVLRVTYLSENGIVVGTDDIIYNETLTGEFKPFQKKVKVPKKVDKFRIEVVSVKNIR